MPTHTHTHTHTRNMTLHTEWYDKEKKQHTHPCFFGTASEILRDCCKACPEVPPELVDPDSPYVSGKRQKHTHTYTHKHKHTCAHTRTRTHTQTPLAHTHAG